MIHISDDERRRAFSAWLRTGRLPGVRNSGGLELKFNPWHDAFNGRFTFSPGGSATTVGSLFGSSAVTRVSHAGAAIGKTHRQITPQSANELAPVANQIRTPVRSGPIVGRGNNRRAFEDPMTLEHAFPGLQNSTGGAVFAVADNLFDFTGPANASITHFLQDQAQQLTVQIKAIDPNWHYDEISPVNAFGTPIVTVEGLSAKVNDLRFQRAAIVARVKGDYGPLQVQTLRFVQQRTDRAYDDAVALLKAGRLTPRLSNQEAVGNYIDREVRRDLRARYNQLGIDWNGKGPVRVNRRENDSSGTDLTYRRPDSRVKDVAFDVTLKRKTLGTAQVRGFFNTDFKPSRVVIIRPSQLGADYTYVISRPETKR